MLFFLGATIHQQRRCSARTRRAHAPERGCAPPPACVMCVTVNWWERRGEDQWLRRRRQVREARRRTGLHVNKEARDALRGRAAERAERAWRLAPRRARNQVSDTMPLMIHTCGVAASSVSGVLVVCRGVGKLDAGRSELFVSFLLSERGGCFQSGVSINTQVIMRGEQVQVCTLQHSTAVKAKVAAVRDAHTHYCHCSVLKNRQYLTAVCVLCWWHCCHHTHKILHVLSWSPPHV